MDFSAGLRGMLFTFLIAAVVSFPLSNTTCRTAEELTTIMNRSVDQLFRNYTEKHHYTKSSYEEMHVPLIPYPIPEELNMTLIQNCLFAFKKYLDLTLRNHNTLAKDLLTEDLEKVIQQTNVLQIHLMENNNLTVSEHFNSALPDYNVVQMKRFGNKVLDLYAQYMPEFNNFFKQC